jgi:thiamine-phosphate pyrophosphorylase
VFPSISKENYLPKYSFEEFRQFLCEHPQEKCIALGGVCENNIRQIQDLGFSGIALLGELWKEKTLDKIINKFVRINKLITP